MTGSQALSQSPQIASRMGDLLEARLRGAGEAYIEVRGGGTIGTALTSDEKKGAT